MAEDKAAIKGKASMWTLSNDKQTVELTILPTSDHHSSASALRVEFDRTSLEATLSKLVEMHFEMMRTAPPKVQHLKH